jgi:hypothetical protein
VRCAFRREIAAKRAVKLADGVKFP